MNMASTVRISIRIKKYHWKEFVHDVIWALAVCAIVANELSKKYLKFSLRELAAEIWRLLKWAYWMGIAAIFIGIFISGIFFAPPTP